MQIEHRQHDNIVIADLQGRLVAGEPQEALRDLIEELLAADQHRIVLNLSQLARIDSSGIGELVAGVRLAKSVGARVVLLQLKASVRRILDISQVLPVLETFDDEQDAFDALA
ncbi:MAG: STAS domain-containing protein [Deltaproteobacteria bacterium]|nr:STAS domain-containing protein [Deltaproteobacteria bacterium]